MEFLIIADLTALCKQDILDILNGGVSTNTNTNELNVVERAAVEEVRSYINPKYDVDAIFAATGDDRNPLIVSHVAHIALYNAHLKMTPNKVPAIREERYQASIEWLNRLARGIVNPLLPVKTITTADGNSAYYTALRYGGKSKKTVDW